LIVVAAKLGVAKKNANRGSQTNLFIFMVFSKTASTRAHRNQPLGIDYDPSYWAVFDADQVVDTLFAQLI
jgi:hypothetical protein